MGIKCSFVTKKKSHLNVLKRHHLKTSKETQFGFKRPLKDSFKFPVVEDHLGMCDLFSRSFVDKVGFPYLYHTDNYYATIFLCGCFADFTGFCEPSIKAFHFPPIFFSLKTLFISWLCLLAHMSLWKSEDKFWSQFSPSTLVSATTQGSPC